MNSHDAHIERCDRDHTNADFDRGYRHAIHNVSMRQGQGQKYLDGFWHGVDVYTGLLAHKRQQDLKDFGARAGFGHVDPVGFLMPGEQIQVQWNKENVWLDAFVLSVETGPIGHGPVEVVMVSDGSIWRVRADQIRKLKPKWKTPDGDTDWDAVAAEGEEAKHMAAGGGVLTGEDVLEDPSLDDNEGLSHTQEKLLRMQSTEWRNLAMDLRNGLASTDKAKATTEAYASALEACAVRLHNILEFHRL